MVLLLLCDFVLAAVIDYYGKQNGLGDTKPHLLPPLIFGKKGYTNPLFFTFFFVFSVAKFVGGVAYFCVFCSFSP